MTGCLNGQAIEGRQRSLGAFDPWQIPFGQSDTATENGDVQIERDMHIRQQGSDRRCRTLNDIFSRCMACAGHLKHLSGINRLFPLLSGGTNRCTRSDALSAPAAAAAAQRTLWIAGGMPDMPSQPVL